VNVQQETELVKKCLQILSYYPATVRIYPSSDSSSASILGASYINKKISNFYVTAVTINEKNIIKKKKRETQLHKLEQNKRPTKPCHLVEGKPLNT
jgi:hypothetical protein